MKAGEKTICPFCKDETILKSKIDTEDWFNKKEILICSICGATLGVPDKEEDSKVEKSSNLNTLASLLGEEVDTSIDINLKEDVYKFCRNCSNFVSNPFKCLCSLTMNEVDPQDNCEEFSQKNL
jgi:hypothetical protein